MQFMVIEHFHEGAAPRVYERALSKGRMLPDGLTYIDSWITDDLTRCYQVMECDDVTLIHHWIESWRDLVDFEVVPVMSSTEAAHKFKHTS